MRIALAASLLLLAGCASHEKPATSNDPHATLASTEGGKSCHGGAAKAEMASSEGTKSCAAKAELASADAGPSCHGTAVKAELASSEGTKSCHGGAAKAELASADAHVCDGGCPVKADGTCDHEAGAKAGRECCKIQLAKTATP